MSVDADIVIVGGGAAGVGAARRLARSPCSVLLLEAAPRLGGRAWTQEIRGLPLDLGCGWLHSAARNSWTDIARNSGIAVDQSPPAWGTQFRDLGFTRAEQAAARRTFESWNRRLAADPPPADCAADALESGNEWNGYVQAVVGFISGAPLERLSSQDYARYDASSSDDNWRLRHGFGSLVARSLPETTRLRLGVAVTSVTLDAEGVTLGTSAGSVRARAAILTVSTDVLAGGAIKLPADLDPWREAASRLPLGRNEKLFLEIDGDGPFETETQVYGNPRDANTGAYYIRPFGYPVIECFFGGESALHVEREGPAAGFDFALRQLGALFGADAPRRLKPLIASQWGRSDRIGGAYSYALPGHASARGVLARPFEQRLYFAGEATSPDDFSTAHGAHDSGARAAGEAIAALFAL